MRDEYRAFSKLKKLEPLLTRSLDPVLKTFGPIPSKRSLQ
jgi:hypothetical protein